ncbi:septum site-determining protein MinC [Sulfurivirga sp.]|uniref:septum site-determining protein MinC n=1 Tax=Sulfurivirga sp. TaxID=2614236 RepID=UPI0025F7AB8E|nr:septum site-determining protein MinC [Sulfurivirga sp.]
MAQPIELKGSVMSFTVLRVHSSDIEAVKSALGKKVEQAPGFFQQVPVVIEPRVAPLPPTFLALLVEHLLQQGMIPIGLRSEDEQVRQQAEIAGLAIFAPERQRGRERRESRDASTSQETATAMVVSQSIRSGQQVYAKGRDLVVLGSVNPGAEVYADGHVHIYGALEGKAFAGARGERGAQIFVQTMDPELVCIAGLYQLADDLPPEFSGKACRIWLEGEQLRFAAL